MIRRRPVSRTAVALEVALQGLREATTKKGADIHPEGNGRLHYLLRAVASQHLGKKQQAKIEEIIRLHQQCCYTTP